MFALTCEMERGHFLALPDVVAVAANRLVAIVLVESIDLQLLERAARAGGASICLQEKSLMRLMHKRMKYCQRLVTH